MEGRLVPGPAYPGVAQLAHVAAACRQLSVPGPDIGARLRMIAAFDDFTAGRNRRRPAAWLIGWLGAGPRPRGLVERFATGALLVAAAGGGVSAVSGETPLAIAREALSFVGNVVQNLGPTTSGGPALPTPGPQVTFAAGVDETATPDTPLAPDTPTPEPATPTPIPAPQASNSPGGAPAPAGQPPAATSTPRTASPAAAPSTATPTPTVQPAAPPTTPAGTPALSPTPSATPTSSPTPTSTPSVSPTPDGEEEHRKEGEH